MGNSRWSASDWASYSASTQQKSQSQIFRSTGLADELDPAKFTVRESRDSAANPESTPIILAVDETGSMGYLAEEIIKRGLGVIMAEIYDRKPVTDPHVMCMGIGDANSDRAPIQMTQFEASVDPLTAQVEKIFLEGNGGGNGGESYNLAWYGAAFKTSCDSQIKRGKKGYLFTIGDEPPHSVIHRDHVSRLFGTTAEADVTSRALLDILTPNWEVFHLGVGDYLGSYGGRAKKDWEALLGERAIHVSDHTKLAEVIVSTIQVIEGHDVAEVVDSWSDGTALVVRDAVRSLKSRGAGTTSSGVVAL